MDRGQEQGYFVFLCWESLQSYLSIALPEHNFNLTQVCLHLCVYQFHLRDHELRLALSVYLHLHNPLLLGLLRRHVQTLQEIRTSGFLVDLQLN